MPQLNVLQLAKTLRLVLEYIL